MNDNVPSNHDQGGARLPAELETWLESQTPEEAAEINAVWQLSEHALLFDPPAEPDEKRFERLKQEVRSEMDSRTAGGVLRILTLRPWIARVAAAVVIMVIAGGVWISRPVIYEAASGEQLDVHLADGTEVSLNSGSSLTHARFLGMLHRNVLLHGEAFFDVTPADKPFSVETFNGKVTVLGTRFNVRAWHSDDEPETVVVLEEGSVELMSHLQSNKPVILKPGELSRISDPTDQPTAPEAVDVEQRLSWRSGGLIFVDVTMGAAVAEIHRRFDVDVELVPETLRHERITLVLNDARNLNDVLDTIAGAVGYEVEQVDGHYRLSKP